MAVELAQAYVSIIPSARGMQGRLAAELDREAGSAGQSASRAFSSRFSSGVTRNLKRGAVALGGGLTIAGGFGLKAAADFEQTRIAFEGILGNKGAADDLIDSLREFANVTPFEFPDLTKSARQLLAVGTPVKDLIPIMGTLGDQAAALGLGAPEIEGVVRALGQMKGKGKVSAEELRQISEQFPGFSAINAIAEDLGVTVGEAFKLVENGAVPADEGIRAILDGMKRFPGASGAMERQSKTLNGVISTFKDTLTTTAIDFITPYLPAISRGVAAFGGFIQNSAVPALEDFIGFISDEIVPGIQDFARLFEEEGFGGVLGRLGEMLGELIRTQGPVVLAALGDLIGVVANWITSDGLPMLGDGFRALVPALVNWIFEDAIPAIVTNLPGIIAAITEWVVTEAVPALLGLGADMALGLLDGIGEALGSAKDWASDIAKQLVNALIGFINDQIIDRINDLLEIHINVPLGPDIDLDPPDIPGIPELRGFGGPVSAGVPYIVGDRGRPELFVPDRDGTILPSVPSLGGGAPFIGGDLVVQQLPGEDAGEALNRTHRKIRVLAGMS